MRAIEQLKQFHRDRIEPKLGKPVGASEDDVRELEVSLGIRLPGDYRQFLLSFGRDTYGVWVGSDCFIDHVLANTKGLPDLLRINGLGNALPSAFVCPFMHQGYIAAWFKVPPDGDDPQCFLFNEGQSDLGIQEPGTIMSFFLEDMKYLSEFLK